MTARIQNLIQKEKRLKDRLEDSLPGVTEGLVLRVYSHGEQIIDLNVGKTYEYYDLASLTKLLFTTTALMKAKENKKISVEHAVAKWLCWFPDKAIRIHQLLNHSSGLTWWKPFYEQLQNIEGRENKRSKLKDLLGEEVLDTPEKSVYSDLGFMTLGFVLEEVYREPMEQVWDTIKWEIGAESLNFHLDNKPVFAMSKYAPTEKCPWRNKILQGEVHDNNAWALGGVAPHAGLFGSLDDVSKWILHLRAVLFDNRKWIVGRSTLEKFIQRSVPPSVGDWGLGFMKPSEGRASCGTYFSPESFGHTGFTGTSVWMDPRKDLLVVMLSNRTYPTRENKKFVELRPQIHNWVHEEYFA